MQSFAKGKSYVEMVTLGRAKSAGSRFHWFQVPGTTGLASQRGWRFPTSNVYGGHCSHLTSTVYLRFKGRAVMVFFMWRALRAKSRDVTHSSVLLLLAEIQGESCSPNPFPPPGPAWYPQPEDGQRPTYPSATHHTSNRPPTHPTFLPWVR